MNEKPRFEILEQIGHGQFSNVYKARWINAPLFVACPPSPGIQSSLMMQPPFVEPPPQQYHQHQHQQPAPQNCLGGCALRPSNPHEPNGFHIDTTNNYHHQQQVLSSHAPSYTHPNTTTTTAGQAPAICGDKYVALKRIKFYDIQNSKLRMDCVKEVKLLQQLKHPNIINYNISFIERNELFIVLELADGGDLSKLIRYFQRRKQLLSERTILKYFTQVCSAVKYIHSKRILHRDIKPANIFMTSDGCVKLGDFGLGRFFSQNTRDAHSIVGTFYYMSPERIRESGYGFSSDIWSLGCVLYELITLNSPFSILNVEQHQQQVVMGNQQQHKTATRNNNDTTKTRQRGQQQQLQQQQPQQQNPYNLQWLIDRIVRADYPSLANYTDHSLRLRQLTTECLNPNPEARPDMEYICAVVGEAYRLQQQHVP